MAHLNLAPSLHRAPAYASCLTRRRARLVALTERMAADLGLSQITWRLPPDKDRRRRGTGGALCRGIGAMMRLSALLHLGDLTVTRPAAVALTAWPIIMRSWRAALWWSGLFTLGIGPVGATKIAFIRWGTGLPSLDFRAVSGHAAGVTALYPSLFYSQLQPSGRRARILRMIAGLLLGVAMCLLLVQLQQHSAAEAFAGWALSALVSPGVIGMAGGTHAAKASGDLLRANLACSALVLPAHRVDDAGRADRFVDNPSRNISFQQSYRVRMGDVHGLHSTGCQAHPFDCEFCQPRFCRPKAISPASIDRGESQRNRIKG